MEHPKGDGAYTRTCKTGAIKNNRWGNEGFKIMYVHINVVNDNTIVL